jgi:hypothetical protein
MIIAVSIVDKHRPQGQRHVGTYFFEIDCPVAAHPGQMDFMVRDCPAEAEPVFRPLLGRLVSASEMPEPVRGDGTRV